MKVNLIKITEFETRDNGLIKIHVNKLPFPGDFQFDHQVLISIPPAGYGGNHKHPRRELFFSLDSNLELRWIEDGLAQKARMREGNTLYLFDVLPHVPHAIVNLSKTDPALLLEFASEELLNVEHLIVA